MTKKISGLTENTSAVGADLIPIVDVSEGASGSRKMTFTNLLSTLVGLLSSSQIPWAKIDKTSSDLANLATKAGTSLTASQTDILLGRKTAGAGSIEEIDCTSFGRSLINSANAAAARDTLVVDSENNGWTQLTSPTFDHVAEVYDGSSFNAVSDWSPSTSYTILDVVSETADETYYHEATNSFTSGISEPTWANIGGFSDDAATNDWFAIGRHVLSVDEDLTDTVKEGMAIKYIYSGSGESYKYAKVVGVNASRVALAGPYLEPSKTISEVWLGNTEKIQQIEIHYEDECGNTANGYCSRISTFSYSGYNWLLSNGYLVQAGFQVADVDTIPSDEDLNINVSLDGILGGAVFYEYGTLASYNGFYPSGTLKTTRYGNVNPSNYTIVYNKNIVALKNTSSNGITTSDLFLTLVFVLE